MRAFEPAMYPPAAPNLHAESVKGSIESRKDVRLGKSTHENVYRSGINVKVIANTSSSCTQSTNRVSLVDIEEEL